MCVNILRQPPVSLKQDFSFQGPPGERGLPGDSGKEGPIVSYSITISCKLCVASRVYRVGIWVCLIVYMPYPTTSESYKVFIPSLYPYKVGTWIIYLLACGIYDCLMWNMVSYSMVIVASYWPRQSYRGIRLNNMTMSVHKTLGAFWQLYAMEISKTALLETYINPYCTITKRDPPFETILLFR